MDELSAIYDVNMQHIQATNSLCPFLLDKRLWYPFYMYLLLASSQITSTASENGEREKDIR